MCSWAVNRHRVNADAIGSAAPGCHFYFARRVTFLSCADIQRDTRRTPAGNREPVEQVVVAGTQLAAIGRYVGKQIDRVTETVRRDWECKSCCIGIERDMPHRPGR